MAGIEGGCRCGAVRYELAIDQLPKTYACHCRDCQTWSGSAFSQQVFLPEGALSLTGPVVTFEMTNPSGRISTQRICGACHTRIFNSNSARPGYVVVRAGTMDRSDELDVVAHIWVKRKQPWLHLPQGVPTWPENAEPLQLLQAMSPR